MKFITLILIPLILIVMIKSSLTFLLLKCMSHVFYHYFHNSFVQYTCDVIFLCTKIKETFQKNLHVQYFQSNCFIVSVGATCKCSNINVKHNHMTLSDILYHSKCSCLSVMMITPPIMGYPYQFYIIVYRLNVKCY